MTRRALLVALALLGLVLPRAGWAQADRPLVVRGLKFEGNHAIDDYRLSIAIGTTNSSTFATAWYFRWIGLGEKRYFDPIEFRRDVLRLILLYRQSGFMEVQVDTVVRRARGNVHLTFKIREGPPVVVRRFTVTGLDSLPDAEATRNALPLEEGQPFDRFLFQASADTIVARLRDRGYPAVEVFRTFDVNREARRAEASLEVVPGPRSHFGAIRVEGARGVDTTFVRQLLAVRPGQRFSQEELFQSQRKLYTTQLFRLATVTIDSTRYSADSSVVPVTVVVSEGPAHRVTSGIGYGTNDCFRGGAGWTDRNLLGTGRRFEVTGRVSKVGVGTPFGLGLENSICSSLKDDPIGSALANYNVTTAVRQPRFFTPDITGTLALYAERRSEFAIYRREEVGVSLGLLRETSQRVPISLAYRLSFGGTVATDATFCAFFNACTPEDARRLQERRLLGVVSASISWPRQNNPLDPGRGHVYTFEAAHSSQLTGSAAFQTFTRATGDAAWYLPVGRKGAVLSAHVRGGMVFSPRVSLDSASGNFVPPEQRFYAGGPNDVRGYNLNELGPLVYVLRADSLSPEALDSLVRGNSDRATRFSATGGNTLGIAQLEFRIPAPIWSSRLRLAAFVDAGTLYERGKTRLAPIQVRVTPGIGLRIATPLGPARFDIGYNGYDRPPGALYLQKSDGTLQLVQTDFVLKRGSRLTYHFSFGQAF